MTSCQTAYWPPDPAATSAKVADDEDDCPAKLSLDRALNLLLKN